MEGLLKLNVESTTWMTRLVLPGMVQRKSGAIVNQSSAAARFPLPLLAGYSAAKGYIENLTRSCAYIYIFLSIHLDLDLDIYLCMYLFVYMSIYIDIYVCIYRELNRVNHHRRRVSRQERARGVRRTTTQPRSGAMPPPPNVSIVNVSVVNTNTSFP